MTMPNLTITKCSNCEYAKDRGDGWIECRRAAPAVVATAEDVITMWPVLSLNKWIEKNAEGKNIYKPELPESSGCAQGLRKK